MISSIGARGKSPTEVFELLQVYDRNVSNKRRGDYLIFQAFGWVPIREWALTRGQHLYQHFRDHLGGLKVGHLFVGWALVLERRLFENSLFRVGAYSMGHLWEKDSFF